MGDAEAEELKLLGRGSGITWRQAVEAWAKARDVGDKYLYEVEGSIDYLLSHLGVDDAEVENLSLDQFRAFVLARQLKGARSANKHRQQILAIARWCREEGYIKAIPFEAVKARGVKSPKRKPVPVEMIPNYIGPLPAFLRPVVAWLVMTGCRSSEACGLRVDQVDMEVGGKARFVMKGGRESAVVLDSDLLGVLEMAKQDKIGRGKRSDYVFLNLRGNPWNSETLSKAVKKVWGGVPGLPLVTLHQFRHTFGTAAGQRFGVDMVQAGLGHSSRRSSEVYVDKTVEMRDLVGREVRGVLADSVRKPLGLTGSDDPILTPLKDVFGKTPLNPGKLGVSFLDPRDGEKALIPWGIIEKCCKNKGQ